MNIGLILDYLYPNAEAGTDYSVDRNTPDGSARIAEWNLPTPQPAEAELRNAEVPAHRREREGEFARRAQSDMAALYPAVSTLTGGWVAEALLDLSANPKTADQTARLASLKGIRDKRARGYANIASAATVNAVNSLVWENQ